MSRNLKVIGANTTKLAVLSPYQEIATYIRDLLRCDYALVAVPQNDAIRICAIAGAEPESSANIADLLSRLRDWGPMVVDDSRLIAVPMTLIRGHVRFVEDSLPVDHPLRNSFEVIERASRRIEEMARRMLDFSRKRTRRTEACEIDELISDALR